jgi:hypothetical protein
MLARTSKGVMQSFSHDGGRTWDEPSFPTFKHPGSRFVIQRLQSGRILLVKHGQTIDTYDSINSGRTKLSAWLSEDEGKTWKGGLMLDGRTALTYPDGFQSPDGTIYISYDRNRAGDGEILMARITEVDILAGKLVHPDSKLLMLVSRPMKNRIPRDLVMLSNADAQPTLTGPGARIDPVAGEIRPLVRNALIYSNREYVFFDVPKALAGKRFVFGSSDHMEVVVREAGAVYVLTPSRQRNASESVEEELLQQGFVKAAFPEVILNLVAGRGRAAETCSVYQKAVKAGEAVRFGKSGVLVF